MVGKPRASFMMVVAALAAVSVPGLGCARQAAEPTAVPGEDAADAEDPLARASRDNAALRRRMQMLEDRVLYLEQEKKPRRAGAAAPGARGDARTGSADPSVRTGTWHASTAAGAMRGDVSKPLRHEGRISRTLGERPSPVALDPAEDLGGYLPRDADAGGVAATSVGPGTPRGGSGQGWVAAEPATASGRSFRLVGSRLAELSKVERKPKVRPPASHGGRAETAPPPRRKPRGNKAIVARYADAMTLLRGGEAEAAERAFDAFARDHAQHDYADNALYWKGEAAYDQRHFADALAAFTRVVEQYGGGNKAPDALLKIGLCYAQLGDRANARDVLTELIAAYPGTPAGTVARVKLQELPSTRAQDD